ncbi:UBC-like protein [Cristinia sonorae]|uniref:UBC-like protein n=1 Tax=Cristinia sonorae TaxID=1940300 RepID=A0A8K0V0R2_9AGAR|nr:UBC-like protein [Cristinia sonorae]
MAARAGYNKNSSAVKRIMQEARELANDPCTDYSAAPLEDDIFEWHCTLRGPPGTEFEGGLYHFRILLPSEYPFRPPSIMMLTPNGRFELNTKICISFTNYHEELWQPAWGVRTAIIGLQGFFPLKGTAAAGVGALEYPSVERKRLATMSREWKCSRCNKTNVECLPDPPTPATPPEDIAQEHVPPKTEPPEAETQPSTEQPQVPLLAPTPKRPLAPMNLTPTSPVFIGPSTPVEELPDEDNAPPAPNPAIHVAAQPALQPIQQDRPNLVVRRTPPRPPIILDTAICVLLVLVFALICRRVL